MNISFFEDTIKKKYFKSLWNIYSRSETVDELFKNILRAITDISGSDIAFLYLEDDSVLNNVTFEKSEMYPSKKLTKEFILASYNIPQNYSLPLNRIPSSRLKLKKQAMISHSTSFQTIPSSYIRLKDPNKNDYFNLLVFDSKKIMLCRALFIIDGTNHEKKVFLL